MKEEQWQERSVDDVAYSYVNKRDNSTYRRVDQTRGAVT